MRKIIYILTLLLTVAAPLLLHGCSNDNDEQMNGNGDVIIDGDMCKLIFNISEDMSVNATSRSAFKCDTLIQPLGDSLVLESVISPDLGILTRGRNTIKDGVKILTVAYSQTRGKYYKRESSTVMGGRFSIHLPVNETYDLVFYAVNNSAGIDLSTDAGYFQGTWTTGGSGNSSFLAGSNGILKAKDGEIARDLMWTKTTIAVNSDTKLPVINMKHLFCCANITVTEQNGANISAFSAELGQGYPNANGVSIDKSQNNIPSWIGGGALQPNTFTNTSGVDKVFIPEITGPITFRFANVTIDGHSYSTTPVTLQSTSFIRGYRYNITSTVKKPESTKYTVKYDANGGTGQTIDNNGPYQPGTSILLSSSTFTPPQGKKFVHWNIKPDGSGQSYNEGSSYVVNDNITFYAIYVKQGMPLYAWDAKEPFVSFPPIPDSDTHLAVTPIYSCKNIPTYAQANQLLAQGVYYDDNGEPCLAGDGTLVTTGVWIMKRTSKKWNPALSLPNYGTQQIKPVTDQVKASGDYEYLPFVGYYMGSKVKYSSVNKGCIIWTKEGPQSGFSEDRGLYFMAIMINKEQAGWYQSITSTAAKDIESGATWRMNAFSILNW